MADTKISALPAASALVGGESVPTVQGGITKKTNPSDISIFVEGNLPQWSVTEFNSGIDYTAGVSTSVTLPSAIAGDDEGRIRVHFLAGFQAPSTYSLSGTTLSFTGAIPAFIEQITVYNLS